MLDPTPVTRSLAETRAAFESYARDAQLENDALRSRAISAEQALVDHLALPAPAGHVTAGPTDPEIPDLPTRTLMGSSIPYDVAGRKRVPLVRCYLKQLGGEWDDYATLRKAASFDPEVVWVSWKDTDPADVAKLLAGRPDDFATWATFHHEPENDLDEGAEAKIYRDKWEQMGRVIRSAGALSVLCLMRFTLSKSSGRDWRQWYPEGAVDVLGWDAYRKGAAGDLGAVESMIDPILRVLDETGLPGAIGETGSTRARYTAEDTVAFAKRLRAYGTAKGLLGMAWWDQDDFRLTDPIARVWLDQAAAA